MKLSIITINFNNCQGLKRTINSIISQTFIDYEWIIIDGGSEDGSRELIEKYSKFFSYWISEPDKGVYNAMNKGLKHIHGEWILFMNSGDVLADSETLKNVFQRSTTADVLYGDYAIVWPDKKEHHKMPSELDLFLFYNYNICHQSIYYRSDIFKDNIYDESYDLFGDWVLNLSLILKGYRFEYIPSILSLIEHGGISTIEDKRGIEIARIRTEVFPYHVRYDMIKMQEYKELLNRKTTRFIFNHTVSLCKKLNIFLIMIESKHKK